MPWAISSAGRSLGTSMAAVRALPPNWRQIDRQHDVPLDAQGLGHAPGGVQLETVPLAVVDRQGVEREALVPGDGGRRGRIEPPR